MSQPSTLNGALVGLGVAIILVSVVLAARSLLISPRTASTDITQNLNQLVTVIIQVLFLAVMMWGGTILLDRGLRRT